VTLALSRRDQRLLDRTTPGRRLVAIRVVVLLASLAGLNYIVWRWAASVNWSSWWIAVPLILAETYSVVDSLLFGLGAWRLRERGEPPTAPDPDDLETRVTVDVFVTTYDEPVDLVMRTALAAQRIGYPHATTAAAPRSARPVRPPASG
jgi:cellulose synthase (UDP-forming)